MSDLKRTGLTAAGTVLANMLFVALLYGLAHIAAAVGPHNQPPPAFFGWAIFGIGVSQIAWVGPAMFMCRERRWAVSGLAIGAALTVLLNGLCFGAVMVIVATSFR